MRILRENMDVLHAAAKLLMDKEKITGDEFRALFPQAEESDGPAQTPPPVPPTAGVTPVPAQ